MAHSYGRRRGATLEQRQANVDASIELAREIIKKGHIPFVPNLYHHIHEGWENSPNEEVWIRIVSAWIEDCQALFVGSERSSDWLNSGVRREINIARALGMTIYWHLEDIPKGNIP